jgi:hypothetical protein
MKDITDVIFHNPTKFRTQVYAVTVHQPSHLYYCWGDPIRYQSNWKLIWFFFWKRKETIIQLAKLRVYFCGLLYDAIIIPNCIASKCEMTGG